MRTTFRPVARVICVAAGGLVLAQCSGQVSNKVDPRYGVAASPRVVAPGQPVPKGGGVYRVGNPYVVAGRRYVPAQNPGYRKEGLASWYGEAFHGRATANGEVFDMHAISAAHPTLPLPSYVRITNLHNRRSIVARLNDRGPFHSNRLVDVSARTAKVLGFHAQGTAHVRVEYVGPASLDGSDDRKLLASLRQDGPAPVRIASAAPFVPRLTAAAPRQRLPIAAAEPYQTSGETPRRGEPTAAARIDTALGPPAISGSVADPAAVPSSGALTVPTSAIAYAPRSLGAGPSFISGRGLY